MRVAVLRTHDPRRCNVGIAQNSSKLGKRMCCTSLPMRLARDRNGQSLAELDGSLQSTSRLTAMRASEAAATRANKSVEVRIRLNDELSSRTSM